MKEIPLTQGKVALIDDEDWELISKYKWRYNNKRAVTSIIKNGKQSALYMNRLLLGEDDNRLTKYKNGDYLDNRRCNIIFIGFKNKESVFSEDKIPTKLSKYKGLYWHKFFKTWEVKILINDKLTSCGFYSDELQAAKAYDIEMLYVFGGKAIKDINFPK
jgi:hypothetical protein